MASKTVEIEEIVCDVCGKKWRVSVDDYQNGRSSGPRGSVESCEAYAMICYRSCDSIFVSTGIQSTGIQSMVVKDVDCIEIHGDFCSIECFKKNLDVIQKQLEKLSSEKVIE
jgi:hypothetical protein